jgi:hypothetical protein
MLWLWQLYSAPIGLPRLAASEYVRRDLRGFDKADTAQYHGVELLARQFLFDSPGCHYRLDIIKKWSAA